MRRLLAVTLVVVACGGPKATVTSGPTDELEAAIAWSESTPLTCAEWNRLDPTRRMFEALSMLATVRTFDRPGQPSPDASTATAFADAVTNLCAGGNDCSDPDLFCDEDRVGEAALAAYTIELERFRP